MDGQIDGQINGQIDGQIDGIYARCFDWIGIKASTQQSNAKVMQAFYYTFSSLDKKIWEKNVCLQPGKLFPWQTFQLLLVYIVLKNC